MNQTDVQYVLAETITGSVLVVECALFISITLSIMILVCCCATKPVMKAHGVVYLLLKCVACILLLFFLFCLYLFPVVLESVWTTEKSDMFFKIMTSIASFTPHLYGFTWFIRFWRIYHTHQYNLLLADVVREKKRQSLIRIHSFAKSKKFYFLFSILLVAFQIIICIVAIFLIIFTPRVVCMGIMGSFALLIFLFYILCIGSVIIASCVKRVKAPYSMFSITSFSIFCMAIFICCIGLSFMNSIWRNVLWILIIARVINGIGIIFVFLEVVLSVCFPLIQCIFYNRITYQTSSNENDPLKRCLQHEKGYVLFFEFTRTEWSSENILFYFIVNEIIAKTEKELDWTEIETLHNLFLKPNSVSQINTSEQTGDELLLVIQQRDQSSVLELLTKLREEVLVLMKDSFSRFQISKKYKQFVEMLRLEESMRKEFKWNTAQTDVSSTIRKSIKTPNN